MNRRGTVLSMGYLVKSPTRSNDKSNLPMFWKLRWCVFAKVCFTDRFGIVQDTKFILSYYDDKQTHFNDQRPKGCLNISHCSDIRSCYKPQAGFNHVFTIKLSNEHSVKFSAPSCQKKFTWIAILHKHRFGSELTKEMSRSSRSQVISGGNFRKNSLKQAASRVRKSGISGSVLKDVPNSQPEANASSLYEEQHTTSTTSQLQSRDTIDETRISSSFQPITNEHRAPSPSPDKNQEDRSHSQSQGNSKDATDISGKRTRLKAKSFSFNESSKETQENKRRYAKLSLPRSLESCSGYDSLFELCQGCQLEDQNKKSGSKLVRRFSSKKRANLSKDDMGDTASATQPAEQGLLFDASSPDGLAPDHSDNLYIEIDDDWLMRVKMLMGDSPDDDVDDDTDDDTDDSSEEEYVRMDIFTFAPTYFPSEKTSFAENTLLSSTEANVCSCVTSLEIGKPPVPLKTYLTLPDDVPITAADVPITVADVPITAADVSSAVANVPIEVADVLVVGADVPIGVANVLIAVADVPIAATDVPSNITEKSPTDTDLTTIPSILCVTSLEMGKPLVPLKTYSTLADDVPTTVADVPITVADVPITAADVSSVVANVPIEVADVPVVGADVPIGVANVPIAVADVPIAATDVPSNITEKSSTDTDLTTIPSILCVTSLEMGKPLVPLKTYSTLADDVPTTVADVPITVADVPITAADVSSVVANVPIEVADVPVVGADVPIGVANVPIAVTDVPIAATDVPSNITEKSSIDTDIATIPSILPSVACLAPTTESHLSQEATHMADNRVPQKVSPLPYAGSFMPEEGASMLPSGSHFPLEPADMLTNRSSVPHEITPVLNKRLVPSPPATYISTEIHMLQKVSPLSNTASCMPQESASTVRTRSRVPNEVPLVPTKSHVPSRPNAVLTTGSCMPQENSHVLTFEGCLSDEIIPLLTTSHVHRPSAPMLATISGLPHRSSPVLTSRNVHLKAADFNPMLCGENRVYPDVEQQLQVCKDGNESPKATDSDQTSISSRFSSIDIQLRESNVVAAAVTQGVIQQLSQASYNVALSLFQNTRNEVCMQRDAKHTSDAVGIGSSLSRLPSDASDASSACAGTESDEADFEIVSETALISEETSL